MCQLIIVPGTETSQDQYCPNVSKYQCSSGIDCPAAMQWSGPLLCKSHTEFCSVCGKPFCPSCIKEHQTDCSKKGNASVEEVTSSQRWTKAS